MTPRDPRHPGGRRRAARNAAILGLVLLAAGCVRPTDAPVEPATTLDVGTCDTAAVGAPASVREHGFFGALFRPAEGTGVLELALSEPELRARATELADQGLLLQDVEAWSHGQQQCFSAVWRRGDGEFRLETGLDGAGLESLTAGLADEGLHLVDVEIDPDAGPESLVALFRTDGVAPRLALGLTAEELRELSSEYAAEGYRLADFESAEGGADYVAIWVPGYEARLELGISIDDLRLQAGKWIDEGLAIEDLELYGNVDVDGQSIGSVDLTLAPTDGAFWQWVGDDTGCIGLRRSQFAPGEDFGPSEAPKAFCGLGPGLGPQEAFESLRLVDIEIVPSTEHSHGSLDQHVLFTHLSPIHDGGSSGPGG